MGNLLSVPRHSAGQVYHEQYIDNWESLPGASIARANAASAQQHRVASMTYRNYMTAAASSPYQTYQQLPSRPNTLLPSNSLLLGRAANHVNEIYTQPELHYDPTAGQQTRVAGYWTNEQQPQRPMIPVIREPAGAAAAAAAAVTNDTFLAIPSQYSERYPQGYAATQLQRHAYQPQHVIPPPTSSNYGAAAAAQYGYYSEDKTELVFPAVRRHSQDYLEETEMHDEEVRPPPEAFCNHHDDAHTRTHSGANDVVVTEEAIEEVVVTCSSGELEEQDEDEEEEKSADKACSTEDNTQSGTRDNSDSPSLETEATVVTVPTPKMHTVMPELNLDLSGLNSSDVSSDESNGEKCWKSPEEVRLGCGRVAALAKHFSQLGEAGLIKFKSRRFAGSRQFMSEPDIASPSSADTKRRTRASIEKFKSETELLKSDKSIATTPEKEWSMILLDIQAKSCLECQEEERSDKTESKRDEKEEEEETEEQDQVKEPDDKSSSKLSLAEQEQIIEQLKEFANLDNADAPLFIPTKEAFNRRDSSSDKETMTDGSLESIRKPKHQQQPRTLIAGSVRLEHFRNHSLPTILSTLNVIPQRRRNGPTTVVAKGKVNSLSKYWSLKDLASSDELDSNNTSNDDILDATDSPIGAKYPVFPTCSRVVSAPEISDDCPRYPSIGGITIKSTISIGRRRSDESPSASSTSSFHSSVRLSKSTSDISRDGFDDRPNDVDVDDDVDDIERVNGRSRSWEKLAPTCNKRHNSRCYTKQRDRNDRCRRGNRVVVCRRRAKSDLDVSERKPTPRFDREDDEWIIRDSPASQQQKEQQRPRQQRQQRTETRKPTAMMMMAAH